ncbi:MAG TPA: EAL domain-containing protein [Geobacteraceae bacterium]|nr:EAL domain-containing protein [Geobacteraceae bacterium]
MNKVSELMSWTEILNRRFTSLGENPLSHEYSITESRAERIRIVAVVRWLLLSVIALYGALAGSTYLFSRYGFFIESVQIVLLISTIIVVVLYNFGCHFNSRLFAEYRFSRHTQVFLDLVAVTVLIHCSGGATSWFWPVYLIVTLEAAYLLDIQHDVWVMGGIGGGLYSFLLIAEHAGILPSVKMPFVDPALNHDALYLFLLALWVVITNAVTAIIANSLMSVIRRETMLVRESEKRLISFIDNAKDLIHCNTPEGKILFMNLAMRRAIGLSPEDSELRGFSGIIGGDYQEAAARELQKTLGGEKAEAVELSFRGEDGSEIFVEGNLTCSFRDGVPALVWGIWHDVTEKKRSQARLYKLAHNDNLTGLPNRILFRDRLKQSIAYANRRKSSVALLFIDLDRFKVINDSLGHPVGDRLLQSVAKTLIASVREVDTVARFGGDEFTIVLGTLEKPGDAEVVARKILDALQKPFNIDNHELFAMGSIGISIFPEHGDDIDSLIKKADIAMYEAKAQGGDRCILYDSSMDENAHKRLLLENSMRKALAKNEFRLVYQPKVDIVSGQITAMEALLRWDHPEYGLINPDEFIPLAEETGLIVPIGEWVLERACSQNMDWVKQGLPKMRVAVNISGYQLQQTDFIERLANVVIQSGMPFDQLEIEITESVIMQNPEFTIQVLNEIQSRGIHISVDDFGTGYSSLAHLKRFSVNTLKIDKSFVRDVESSKTDAAITSAIIAMGNSLNLRVIAEGVETQGQYTFLQEAMCDEVQGYLVSRPIRPEKVYDFMKSRGWEGRRAAD